MRLNEKQKAFADYYIELGNATKAAVKAGYSMNYAKAQSHKLLDNVGISSYIDERLKQIEDDRIADASEVLIRLTEVLRGESESEVVVVEGDGMGFSSAKRIVKKPDERERLKAAELLGKRYGLFKDNVTLRGQLSVVVVDDVPEE